MRITVNHKLRSVYERRYWRMTRKVLVECRQSVVDRAEWTDPASLKGMVKDLLNSKPMKEHIINLWGEVGGKFGYDTGLMIHVVKSGTPSMQYKEDKLTLWKERMRRYAAERSLQKIEAIMNTEQEAINTVIDRVIDKVNAEGIGIGEARNLMKASLEDETLLEIENWQAERIARTEVISASNTASFESVKESGIEGIKKIWSTSGLSNVRETHAQYESEDEQSGGREMDEEYTQGLQFPGDANGSPEEVINCACTQIWNVD